MRHGGVVVVCLASWLFLWADARELVATAASCEDFERLIHDASVARISVVGVIAARDCEWRDEPIPSRHVVLSGGGTGTLDYRGMNESVFLGLGMQMLFSEMVLVADTVMAESYDWVQPDGDVAYCRLENSVLRFESCVKHMSEHPWMLGIWGSNKAGHDGNICGSESGGIMMNKVDLPASGGITVQIRRTEVVCDDFGAETLQHFNFVQCKRDEHGWKVLSSSTKLKMLGVLVVTVPIAVLIMAACHILLHFRKKKGPAIREDKLLPVIEEIHSTRTDDGSEDFVALEDVQLGTVIGKGGFSTVYHATLNGKHVAVKMFENRGPTLVEKEPSEALVSSTVVHQNVVRCIAHRTCDWSKFPSGYGSLSAHHHAEDSLSSDVSDAFDFVEMAAPSPEGNCTRTWLIMEYCNMGSMYTAIKGGLLHEDQDRSIPNLKLIVAAAIDVAQAMQHLNDVGVIHGDLKSQNVLLQASESDKRGYVCKVGDFGFSRLAINSTHIQTFTCGSVRAMPPEVLKDGFLTPAADVYSFGILLWELLRGRPPYQGWSHQTILHNVVRGRRPRVPDEWPSGLGTLIRDCLSQSHTARPNFASIIERLNAVDVKQSVRAFDEPSCPANSELQDVFFSCSCCTEDNDGLQIPQTLGICPEKSSRFVIGVDSSKSFDQSEEGLCDLDGKKLWMGMNWH